DEAVRETLREMEATVATRVRRRGACEDRVTGNMVAAVVTHDASRALDPQLHTHLCLMNVTYDPVEERWKGVQPSALYRHQGYFREVCYSRLSVRMQAAGYELEEVRGIGFNISGVPPELRQQFSKRRRDILLQARETGASGQDALQSIAADSRAEKVKVPPAELRRRWRAEAGTGLAALQAVVTQANGTRRAPPGLDAAAALASAEAHLFERRSVVDRRILLREALRAGRGNTGLEELHRELEKRVGQGALLQVGEDLASRDALACEREFIGWAHANRHACYPLGFAGDIEGLSEEQAGAVRQVLGSRGRVAILQGDAGTGKTTCLRAIVAGIEAAGGEAFGCAPSASATDVLRHQLTANADTLQQWLVNEPLREQTKGRVLIVDEAGLVSGPQMLALCRLAARHDNRIILVGDVKQHHSVEAGDALRCLQKFARVPVSRLTQIRRQRNPDYRAAVAALADGDTYGAFRRFEKLGAVREIPEPLDLFRAAAADYVRTVTAGTTCLAVTPVWSEIHDFTAEVRTQLRAAGTLIGEERQVQVIFPLQWTQEERRTVQNYQRGDVLAFHTASVGFRKGELLVVQGRERGQLIVEDSEGRQRQFSPRRVNGFQVGLRREIGLALGERLLIRANDASLRLKNGDLGEVAAFAPDGTITLKDGRHLPPHFRHFSHGYATTSHSAQGRTVERGILILAGEGIAAANLQQAYVSNSRFRDSQMIYTTDRESAREAMARPGDRLLASEVVEPENETTERESLWQRYFAPSRPGQTAGRPR
ncbi:MAG TPA: MobF family relaxase, partial [Candidatus Limnocylindria bacterium]|nr:MobF family relaxase [Candidatus Limnocylindria bacterium]